MKKLKLIFCILFQVLVLYFFSTEVSAVCLPPFAKIDSISAHDECLDINDKTKFCGGSIEIKNNCKKTYYVDDKQLKPGSAVYPSLSNPTWSIFIRDENRTEEIVVKGTSNTENFNSGNRGETKVTLEFFKVVEILAVAVLGLFFLRKFILKRREKK